MKKKQKAVKKSVESIDRWRQATFWLVTGILVLVPLAFSTSIRSIFSLPKFIVLLIGAALLGLTLTQTLFIQPGDLPLLKSRPVKLIYLYFAALTLSTAFGVAPMVSLFGTTGFTGWLTHLGFLVCSVALLVGIGESEKRLRVTLWAIAGTGGLIALYAILQFAGADPFLPKSVYTFNAAADSFIRVCGSLGHSNYLANFLLYTTPLSAGLALASNGLLRAFGLTVTGLSLIAILASGVRGAWLGIVVGAIVMAIFEWKAASQKGVLADRKLVLRAGLGVAAIVVLAGAVLLLSPAGRSIKERVQTLRKEGLASSGRLLLWRDAVKMVPAYALIGCGPEGFRKAFLAYKSKELAQLSPKANNESSHNLYLDNFISYGLLGGVLYLLLIGSTVLLLVRAHRQAQDSAWRVVVAGLLAAFSAVLAHNLFIYNQLATGLYFFAFIALAVLMATLIDRQSVTSQTGVANAAPDPPAQPANRQQAFLPRPILALVMAGVIVVALWFAVGLFRAEQAASTLFSPTVINNFETLRQQGERAAASPLPTGAYDFLFARALDTYTRNLISQNVARGVADLSGDAAVLKQQALQLAISHAEQSLAHTNTPDMNYSLLASLALTAGDTDKLNRAAREAVRYDPNNYYTRSLMAEAHLARGEKEEAAREAELGLELYHVSEEAAVALARARGENVNTYSAIELAAARQRSRKAKHSVEELLQIARRLSQAGKLKKARIKLLTALASNDGNCADCHRELALIFEKQGNQTNAISEWELFIAQATEPTAIAQAKTRLQTLKQGSNPKP
jgi:O-antigen ligase/Tfp pilus assembly protein PilF